MKITFACDHGGFALRAPILDYIQKSGYEVLDLWPQSIDTLDNFPDYAGIVCRAMLDGKADRGILVCGTGIGMCIAANRFNRIRAVVAYSPEIAKISRQHNDTNVICFGGRTMKIEDVLQSLDIFLSEPFLGGKYEKRNEEIDCLC